MFATQTETPSSRFQGYRDNNGNYVPFHEADAVLERARTIGTRVLLRLVLNEKQELEGILYTNDTGLSGNTV